MKWRRTKGSRDPLSMVLLLRAPHFFSAGELRLAAERAWHRSFAGVEQGSMYCVVQKGPITLMKAGPHLLNFFHYQSPYIENHTANVGWLPKAAQREAWLQHSACVGVDYLNQGQSVEVAYCVLAQLTSEMLDGNCTGIYVPRERALIPNDESLYLELHKFGSACESGVNAKT